MTESPSSTSTTVRQLIDQQLHFTSHGVQLNHDDNLWDLGMTSLTCLGLMLSIEDTFEIELPEEVLQESTFRTVGTITAAVDTALGSPQKSSAGEGAPARN